MHELSITQSILEISLRHAAQANAIQIVDIFLVIGEYSSILDESVQFYWETIAQGTIAEHARLHFQRVPAEMTCLDCSFVFCPVEGAFICPQCLSPRVKISKGDEFRVESINIE